MPTYTVEAEVVSSTTKSQPIVVKATMVLSITTKQEQAIAFLSQQAILEAIQKNISICYLAPPPWLRSLCSS
jgi:hypothetical protein